MTFLALLCHASERGFTVEQMSLRRIVLSRPDIVIPLRVVYRLDLGGLWVRAL